MLFVKWNIKKEITKDSKNHQFCLHPFRHSTVSQKLIKSWSKGGQRVVKGWSKGCQKVVHSWSKRGQKLVYCWWKFGQLSEKLVKSCKSQLRQSNNLISVPHNLFGIPMSKVITQSLEFCMQYAELKKRLG